MTPVSPLHAFLPVIVFGLVVAGLCLAIIAWGYITGWLEDEGVARENALRRALAQREAQRQAYRQLDDVYKAARTAIHEQARRQ